MEGLISSESSGQGFGLYKWYYAYSTKDTRNRRRIHNTFLYNNRKNASSTTRSEKCRQKTPAVDQQINTYNWNSYPFETGSAFGQGCHRNLQTGQIDSGQKFFEFWTGPTVDDRKTSGLPVRQCRYFPELETLESFPYSLNYDATFKNSTPV